MALLFVKGKFHYKGTIEFEDAGTGKITTLEGRFFNVMCGSSCSTYGGCCRVICRRPPFYTAIYRSDLSVFFLATPISVVRCQHEPHCC